MKILIGILTLVGVMFATTAAGPREVKYEIFLFDATSRAYILEGTASVSITYDGCGDNCPSGIGTVGNQHPHASVWLPASVQEFTITAEATGYQTAEVEHTTGGKQHTGGQGIFIPLWPALDH